MSITQPTLTPYAGTGDIALTPTLPGNRLAVRSLILGALGLVLLGPVTGVPGIVFGVRARRAARAGEATNAGAALGGLVLSWAATVLSVGAVVLIAIGGVSL
ncbi:MAG: DUF4190 domain-containing protein [Bifidobacteriaceae bacterium]|jgi:hypothetical protein|nr:DUF4190 domain-containing protein [Bifidobacteriaceae bacterium]